MPVLRSLSLVLLLLAAVPTFAQSLPADYGTVRGLGFTAHVQPLLAERDVFGFGDAEAYAWDALFESEAGATIVPFDAEGSDLVRFVEDLDAATPIPYPNLRTLRPDELAFLKRWIEAGARDDDGAVPYADAEHVLFACVQGENLVALIDAARRRVIRRVYLDDHGLPSAPYGPHHIVFAPDDSAWFVSLISAGAIAKLSMDLSLDPSDPAYLLAASPPGGFTTPGMMALYGAAERLFVGRSTLSSGGTYGLGVFDAMTMQFDEEIPLPAFDIPHALALTPDGRYLLTAPLSGRDALVVDAASGDLVAQTRLGPANRELVHFSVLPDGHTATLTSNSEGTSEVLFFTLGNEGTLTLTGSVPTGDRAWHGHLDSDGRTLLVPNRAGNSVTLIDVPDGEVRLTAENADANGPIAMPHSPAPTYEGAFFVSSSNLQGTWAPPFRWLGEADGAGVRTPLPNDAFGNVTVLDATTGAVVAVIPLGRYPSGVEHPMHHGMNHGEMKHEGMNHEQMDHSGHEGMKH